MKRIVLLAFIGSLALVLTAWGAPREKHANRAAKSKSASSAHVVSARSGGHAAKARTPQSVRPQGKSNSVTHGSRAGRSRMKRREPAAREQLIALRREKRQPATARRLIVRRLSLTLSEPIARKRQEPAAREMLTVPRRERHSPETNQPLIVREGSLARTPCGTTAQKQLESTEPALRRLMSGGLPPGIWR